MWQLLGGGKQSKVYIFVSSVFEKRKTKKNIPKGSRRDTSRALLLLSMLLVVRVVVVVRVTAVVVVVFTVEVWW